MTSRPQFRIRYWGVTGTLARTTRPGEITERIAQAIKHLIDAGQLGELAQSRPDAATIRDRLESCLPWSLRSTYLGNTTCIEIETPRESIIFDCGSGIRDLGHDLARRWNAPGFAGKREAHVILSHPHIDHIIGIPFVELMYDPRNDFTIWGPQNVLDGLAAVLGDKSQLSKIYVPTGYREMVGIKRFRPIVAGEAFEIGATRFKTFALNHPGGCVAYRLESGDKSVVLASDHEHAQSPDHSLAQFSKDADLLYTDGQYLPDEYDGTAAIGDSRPVSHRGWGHSTVDAVVATAIAAGVRRLHVGHHEPQRSEPDLCRLELRVQRLVKAGLNEADRSPDACQARLAYEGLTVEI